MDISVLFGAEFDGNFLYNHRIIKKLHPKLHIWHICSELIFSWVLWSLKIIALIIGEAYYVGVVKLEDHKK